MFVCQCFDSCARGGGREVALSIEASGAVRALGCKRDSTFHVEKQDDKSGGRGECAACSRASLLRYESIDMC